jgi:hypothetical protein
VVKQRLRRARVRFDEPRQWLPGLSGSGLQAACDASARGRQAFFDRWSQQLPPWPMAPADRAAGYDHRLAISQLEVSLTDVFAARCKGDTSSRRSSATISTSGGPIAWDSVSIRIQRCDAATHLRLSHTGDHRRR